MTISNQSSNIFNSHSAGKKHDNFADTMKLMTTVAGITGGTYIASNQFNNILSSATTEDYLKSLAISGIIGAALYYGWKSVLPMWHEVTEYRHDRSPFITARTYYNPKTKKLEKFSETLANNAHNTSLYYL